MDASSEIMTTTPHTDFPDSSMTNQSTPTAAAERGRAAVTPSRAIAVILTILAAFGAVSTDMYLPSLPAIADGLSAAPANAQLTLSGFLVGFAVMQLFYGPLSDGFGRKPSFWQGWSSTPLPAGSARWPPASSF